MDEILDRAIPKEKVYKGNSFWVAAFLGGPLAAGYLFAENFKALGQQEKVAPTWIITIAATVIIFGGIFLIPENINIPNQVIPITYTAIAFGLFKKYQEEKVNEHMAQGGLVHKWGQVAIVSVVGLLVSTAVIFGSVYGFDAIDQANISTKTYGTVVIHEIDFDKSVISESEVDDIALGFEEAGFFDLSIAKYVYLEKNGNTYELTLPVLYGTENDEEALQYYVELRDQMDDYLPNNKVEFKLAVDYLDNIVKEIK